MGCPNNLARLWDIIKIRNIIEHQNFKQYDKNVPGVTLFRDCFDRLIRQNHSSTNCGQCSGYACGGGDGPKIGDLTQHRVSRYPEKLQPHFQNNLTR